LLGDAFVVTVILDRPETDELDSGRVDTRLGQKSLAGSDRIWETRALEEGTVIFARDVLGPEGPVWLPDGTLVFTEMARGIISHIEADGSNKRQIAYTGRPSGLAIDRNGVLWVAESKYPALLRVTLDGNVAPVTKGPETMPFLWPNDICIGPDGALYMTDSGALVDQIEVPGEAPWAPYEKLVDGRVWRIDRETGSCQLIDRHLRFANGLAFGPSGTHLYVGETYTGNIFRYSVDEGGVGERELFGNVMVKPPIEFRAVAGPDGMAFDLDGNLHVAVLRQGDVTVLGQDGSVRQRRKVAGYFPTNLAFAPGGDERLLVTEVSQSQLLMYKAAVGGLPLYD
jgi:gluconolactonase